MNKSARTHTHARAHSQAHTRHTRKHIQKSYIQKHRIHYTAQILYKLPRKNVVDERFSMTFLRTTKKKKYDRYTKLIRSIDSRSVLFAVLTFSQQQLRVRHHIVFVVQTCGLQCFRHCRLTKVQNERFNWSNSME